MKRLTSFRILVAAAAASAPVLQAHALDIIPLAGTGYFQQEAAAPKSSGEVIAAQTTHVQKNMLGWEIVTYDVSPAGPQGPVRDEANPQNDAVRAADQAFWRRLEPIGGMDTP